LTGAKVSRETEEMHHAAAQSCTIAAALCALAWGCGSDDGGGSSDLTIPDRPLSGSIESAAWSAVSGETRVAPERTDIVFGQIYPAQMTGCRSAFVTPYINLSLPLEPGSYEINVDSGLYGAFGVEDEQGILHVMLTYTGRIEIDSVDDTAISGSARLVLEDREGFDVGGSFRVDRCE
jgi:hypothetical protein